MSDYSGMSDTELRRAIAAALGWTDIREDDWYVDDFAMTGIDPAMRPDVRFAVPDWPGSIDEALGLVQTDGSQVIDLHWNPGRRPDHNNFVVLYDYSRDKNYSASGFEGSVLLSRCICEAWLTWKDAQA